MVELVFQPFFSFLSCLQLPGATGEVLFCQTYTMMIFALPQAHSDGACIPWTSRHTSHHKERVTHNKSFLLGCFLRFFISVTELYHGISDEKHYDSYLVNNSGTCGIPLLCVTRIVYGILYSGCQDLDLTGTVKEWRKERQGDTQKHRKPGFGYTGHLTEKSQQPRCSVVYYRVVSRLLHTTVQGGKVVKQTGTTKVGFMVNSWVNETGLVNCERSPLCRGSLQAVNIKGEKLLWIFFAHSVNIDRQTRESFFSPFPSESQPGKKALPCLHGFLDMTVPRSTAHTDLSDSGIFLNTAFTIL